jgi:hypothetical protein
MEGAFRAMVSVTDTQVGMGVHNTVRRKWMGALFLSQTATDRILSWKWSVGTFVGTLHQNGGKWRAILLSAHIRAPSVND